MSHVFITEVFDRIDITYPNTVTEVYTYSLHGTNVSSIQVVYTDSTKAELLSIEKLS